MERLYVRARGQYKSYSSFEGQLGELLFYFKPKTLMYTPLLPF